MSWTSEDRTFINGLKTPYGIQYFLDSIPYNPVGECRSPRRIMHEPKAHCFEGALFAAAMLREQGYPPLILDMYADNDDDHVIALFRQHNLWGAIAKSNTTALRFREPVYRTIRELVMSYFDFYFNVDGYKSLRAYTRPVNLKRFDTRDWATADEDLEYIGNYLTGLKHTPVIGDETVGMLQVADQRLRDAVFMGANADGLFVPR